MTDDELKVCEQWAIAVGFTSGAAMRAIFSLALKRDVTMDESTAVLTTIYRRRCKRLRLDPGPTYGEMTRSNVTAFRPAAGAPNLFGWALDLTRGSDE